MHVYIDHVPISKQLLVLSFSVYVGAIVITLYNIGGTGSIFLDDVSCIGNESRLIDCSHNGLGVHDCTHADDAGVRCLRLCKCM